MKTYTLIFASLLTLTACPGAKAPPSPDAEAGAPSDAAAPAASASAAPVVDAGPMVPDKAKK